MSLGAVVLAHGGGAPEAATVLVPVLIVIAFVVRERQNVRKLREQDRDQDEDGTPVDSGSSPP
jgi:hypothetical protein